MHDMFLCCPWHELPTSNHHLPCLQETIPLSLSGMLPHSCLDYCIGGLQQCWGLKIRQYT